MANWSRMKHDAIKNVFGKSKSATITGTVVTAAYTLLIMIVPINLSPEFIAYLGPILGGFAAGAILGTNVYDAVMYGVRAGAYGFVIVAVVVVIGSFILFLEATGQRYFYVSSFLGLLIVFAIVPLSAFAGGVGGPIGTLARRAVLPSEYNPPIR